MQGYEMFLNLLMFFSALYYGTQSSKRIIQIVITCDFWVSVIQLKLYIVGDAQASYVTYFTKHIAITQTSTNIACLLC